jgi:hypothetical protein
MPNRASSFANITLHRWEEGRDAARGRRRLGRFAELRRDIAGISPKMPRVSRRFVTMELGGLEPPTSWVRSTRPAVE